MLDDRYISSGTNAIQIYSPVLDNIPPYTAITSVLDDNGNPIQNGGSTVSTSITFQVSATPGSNPIAGFECSLDASQFSTCVPILILAQLAMTTWQVDSSIHLKLEQ